MGKLQPMLWRPRRTVFLALPVAALLTLSGVAADGREKGDVLRIGTSGKLTGNTNAAAEKAGMETLQVFIKEETGLANDIEREKNWQDVADKLAKGQLQLGVFQGYEFAWAQEKYPQLKPLALAVNVYRYPVAYVVARRDDAAKNFAGLQGQSVAIPETGAAYLRLFADRQAEANGKRTDAFFTKIAAPDNYEDALDGVVDGKVQAAVVDRAALEAYKRRKPGRFNQLKEVAHSQPFPPAVVAYYDNKLNDATLRRFREGLLGAAKKEKGQTLLTMFKLTGFEAVPDDFGKVLAETRKAYPPSGGKTD